MFAELRDHTFLHNWISIFNHSCRPLVTIRIMLFFFFIYRVSVLAWKSPHLEAKSFFLYSFKSSLQGWERTVPAAFLCPPQRVIPVGLAGMRLLWRGWEKDSSRVFIVNMNGILSRSATWRTRRTYIRTRAEPSQCKAAKRLAALTLFLFIFVFLIHLHFILFYFILIYSAHLLLHAWPFWLVALIIYSRIKKKQSGAGSVF